MKKILTLAGILLGFLASGQSANRDQLIAISNTYNDFMFMGTPTKKTIETLKSSAPKELKTTAEFVTQAITSNNKLLTPAYLTLPDETVLKQLYIVREIHGQLNSETPVSIEMLVDSLAIKTISRNELIYNYYKLLFTSCGNKNKPFNLSKIDFDLDAYQLKNETEKGIFFLGCMDFCGTMIWGYMNIPNPPNTSEAYKHIQKFPKFGGQPYYAYNRFFFPDFDMVIVQDKEAQSYKSYYLDKYYGTLLSHLICLIKENASQKDIDKLLLGSILRDERLYQYTKLKETLEEIFKEK